ncbi:WD40/YVTN/BNR-like repeat-containing protein [Pseudoduganella namucuonensis]|uniref:Photosynthesis system II assembly factor Ycf48/Hcf136-like domain-containing protein n=1 Tax=Pseudoduganella namucuonensis TaxID=1035707 RepID=A0A1I7LHX4_9BURK|nr:YCF48-related protein [Pseudoduganella namucuonensis]SFV09254.1 Uncharacterized protein SAMN05216552_102969 [Pseudoduganella namucuonensis]
MRLPSTTLCLLLLAAQAQAAGAAAPGPAGAALDRPAVMSPRAAQAVMLGAAMAGARIVAVGERGLVLTSDDGGAKWVQAAVPTSVTLTAVRFADAKLGVAVGHAGVALVTRDGGGQWRRALDGQRIAALAMESAKARNDAAALRDAERLAADGADKPLLDICLMGGGRMLAVGAYGLAFGSDDGGQTWTPWMARMDNPQGLHLNTVRQRGDTILIAGERGLALLSTDAGRSFQRLRVPYEGSFFTAELVATVPNGAEGGPEAAIPSFPRRRESKACCGAGDANLGSRLRGSDGIASNPAPSATGPTIVLAGLRGNAWQSADAGRTWRQLASPAPVSITASATRANGKLVFVNQAGMLLAREGLALVPMPSAPLPPLTGLLELNNGALLALTIQGLVPLPAQAAGGKP